MTQPEAIALFKCLGDGSRLELVKALLEEPMYVERLAERLGLTVSTTSFHLKKLETAGIVQSEKQQYYTMYSLNQQTLNTNILDIIRDRSPELEEQLRREAQYRAKVLKSFIQDGRLVSIPVQQKKRRIVLEEIARRFEPGREYPEKEVNLIIADFHEDYCFIRREMIAEGIMTRDNSVYRLL